MVTEAAYAALAAENAVLRHDLAVARDDLTTALQRIAALEAKKTPPPSFVKANRPMREPTVRRRRAPAQNRARQREQPTDTQRHHLRLCPDCGSRLGGVHVGRRRQVVDVPPPVAVVVTEHQMEKGWCAGCRKWHEASLDLSGIVVGQRRLGIRVAALVAHLRTVLRLPIRSIQRYLADLHGLRVSVGEIVGLLQQVAAHGATAVTQIRDQARRRPVVHADETSWREAGRNGYAWLLATPEGERYVERHQSRAGAVANALLGEDFTGVLVTDFYAGYNDTPGGQHQRCWVHLLRDLHALGEAHPTHDETQTWVAQVKAVFACIQSSLQSPRTSDERALPLVERLHRELRTLGAQFVQARDHPCRPLAWRLWHFQHELLTCVSDPRVPPDNNAAERAIRPLVIARKISGGTRSARGSQTQMCLYSLAATWLVQGHAPLDEFRRLLQTPFPQV
ncbi:MAG TPA: IS66 family transposase [Ktedonobacterales bacterium]|nr:IS66 family transposase [Ktedonobacterales bacterium]